VTTYEELVARLPDNNLGTIGADDVRAIVEQLTPAYYIVQGMSPVTTTLPPASWTDLPIGAPDLASDRWAASDPQYTGAEDRIAEVSILGDAAAPLPTGLQYRLAIKRSGSTIPVVTVGEPSIVTHINLLTGDEVLLQARHTSLTAEPLTVNWLLVSIVAHFQGPLLPQGV
jgi:hypothetical protein